MGPGMADLLAFRLSGSLTRRDGVLTNVRLSKQQNNLHNDAIRGQLLFTPASNFSLRLIGDWSNFHNECCTQDFVRVAPTLKPAAQQYAGRYADYPKGPCPIELSGSATASCDLTGKGLPGLPKWSGSIGGEYVAPLALGHRSGDLFLRADASAKTKIFGDATDSAYTVVDGYTRVNASIGYRTPHWELAVFARNLRGENYMQNLTVQAGNSGLIVGTPGDPRMFGITLRMRR